MNLPRRHFLHLVAAVAAFPTTSAIARAQAYPARSVRWVVPWPAGGPADISARMIGEWLSQRFAQTFVIDNRPGAAGNIGTEVVAASPPDGYTLLLAGSFNAINATLYDKLKFDFLRDIAPVAGIMRNPLVMVVNPSVPVNSVAEFIAYAKANPGKLNAGTGGAGSPQHMASELFRMMADVNLVPVHYRGSAPMLTDLLRGELQVSFDPIIDRACQNGQAPRVGSDNSGSLRGAARHPRARRVPARVRDQRMDRHRGAEGHPKPTSSKGSTERSTRAWLTPPSRRALPSWAARRSPVRRAISERSWRGKLRSGRG